MNEVFQLGSQQTEAKENQLPHPADCPSFVQCKRQWIFWDASAGCQPKSNFSSTSISQSFSPGLLSGITNTLLIFSNT